jgi:CheY-like chemotaxis protein
MNTDTPMPYPGDASPAAAAAPAAGRIHQLETELAQARAEFAALNNRMSHDMQSLLRNIAGFATFVRDSAGDRLSEREAKYLGRIEAGAHRGAAVARDLASLATVATSELRRSAVDPVSLARQAAVDLDLAGDSRRVEVVLPEGPALKVDADVVLTRLAIWHLLANAVKFTRPKQSARILITAEAQADSCVFGVSDNGVGFSPEYAHKLFKPLERLHTEQEFEGSGIGLAVVKEVATRHGGHVGAQLIDGGGARFWFTLPLARTSPVAQRSASTRGVCSSPQLVVAIDDEPLVLMTVKALLERDGYEVVTALGGEEGMRLMRALAEDGRKVDVVVSDWLMPRVGGSDIAQAAKEMHPSSRVVVLTGMRADVDTDQAMHGTIDDIVTKPMRAADLRRAVSPLTDS